MTRTDLTFTSGTGIANTAMTFSGRLLDLNRALDGMSFAPTANYHGPAVVQVAVDDLGNFGSGGPLDVLCKC